MVTLRAARSWVQYFSDLQVQYQTRLEIATFRKEKDGESFHFSLLLSGAVTNRIFTALEKELKTDKLVIKRLVQEQTEIEKQTNQWYLRGRQAELRNTQFLDS